MGHLRAFFARIIEWGYPDAPARPPVFASDRPIKDTPLPQVPRRRSRGRVHGRGADPARSAGPAARRVPRPPRHAHRLGCSACASTRSCRSKSASWLRTPIGKLHTDRYIPLHTTVKDLLDAFIADRPDWQASDLLLTHRGRPIPPSRVDKAVQDAATAAGIGHVHPHQLRHSLATQAINRGMSLEAIAALLGHQTTTMTKG